MEQPESKVEVSLREPKVQSFLNDLMELCFKYNISIVTDYDPETRVVFHNWDSFSSLEADSEGASMYWPRIQTEIVVRRNHESIKLA